MSFWGQFDPFKSMEIGQNLVAYYIRILVYRASHSAAFAVEINASCLKRTRKWSPSMQKGLDSETLRLVLFLLHNASNPWYVLKEVRVHYQTIIWKSEHCATQELPSVDTTDLKYCERGLEPILMFLSPSFLHVWKSSLVRVRRNALIFTANAAKMGCTHCTTVYGCNQRLLFDQFSCNSST